MVYVDDFNIAFGRMKLSHMIADTNAELLEMADKIGLNKKHIQHKDTFQEHFDVSLSKKQLAIKNGAKEITVRELSKITIEKRNKELQKIKLK